MSLFALGIKFKVQSYFHFFILNRFLVIPNKAAVVLLSIDRQSENLWIPGILFSAKSHSKKIGDLSIKKIFGK